jgi:hypothetical protein
MGPSRSLRLECDEQTQYRCVGLIQGAMEHYATELAGKPERDSDDSEGEGSDGEEEKTKAEEKDAKSELGNVAM